MVSRPLVICEAGTPVEIGSENEKGFKKSIETGQLWSLHPETGRLLPYRQGVAASVEDRGTWYVATLTDEPAVAEQTAARSEVADSKPLSGTGSEIGAVLTGLATLIAERRREMPEGSYTTHLFERGNEKIRKKTGEEAVELILARDRSELTSEAADLIYHLLVLLEVEDISLDQLAAELKRR